MRSEILQELQAEYEQQRARDQAEELRRQAEAVAACPEIGEVLEARQRMIFGGLRGILDGRAQAEELPARMDVLNRRLASLLRAKGWPEDYLEPVYRCKRCRDTGYIGEPVRTMCPCMRSAFYARLYQRVGLGTDDEASFDRSDLSVFSDKALEGKPYSQRDLMRRVEKRCRDWAERYPDDPAQDLVLTGQSGLGKTFLLRAMARVLLERGVNVLLVSAYCFFEIARKAYLGGPAEELASLMETDVLMIDDLGSEPMVRNITIETLFNLINERQNAGRGLVISTNLNQEELCARYTERIASRLLSNPRQSQLLQLLGEDVRRRTK